MFEMVIVPARTAAARRRFGFLAVSVASYTLLALGTFADVEFPTTAPGVSPWQVYAGSVCSDHRYEWLPKVYVPGGEVKPARVLHHVPGAWTRGCRMGEVKLNCIIDPSGNVMNPEITYSTSEDLKDIACNVLHHWRFAPGTLHGRPVHTRLDVTIRFVGY